ncbi:MAG: hypothetical protein M0P73_09835 [Syntrophobacterales bacterium]|jgi:hypothetical protein|nr:hypothetical protein [Syntrophobacterales bacterium]
MSTAFSFFLRLFLCFVAAKFLLQAIGVEGRGYLVGLTILFLGNVYLFSYLVFRDQTAPPIRKESGGPPKPTDAAPQGEKAPENPLPPEV